ncbi:MAG: manganese catalase family protein [Bacilli bacterium]
MWKYEKKLQYPVSIRNKDLKMAQNLLAQYAGPNSEMTAFITYFNQRFSMPDDRGRALLTDIATEEMAHIEIIATMIIQLIKGSTIEEIKRAGLEGFYSEHDTTLFPVNPSGTPFTAAYVVTTGDHITDLESDMAGEQRARATYEHLLDLTEDKDIIGPLEFLRQREIIHYQRFKELRNYYLENKI